MRKPGDALDNPPPLSVFDQGADSRQICRPQRLISAIVVSMWVGAGVTDSHNYVFYGCHQFVTQGMDAPHPWQ